MSYSLTVAELIERLKLCPQDLRVATHANNHTFDGWPGSHMRVVVRHGRVTIGNLSTYNGIPYADQEANVLEGEVVPPPTPAEKP